MLIKEYMTRGIEAKHKITENIENNATIIIYLKTGRMVELWITKTSKMILFETYTDYKKIKKEEINELNKNVKKIKDGIRFSYKECKFQMPYEYVEDEKKYYEKIKNGIFDEEVDKIIKEYEKNKLKKEELIALSINSEEDEGVIIHTIGENEMKVCEKLKEKGLIEYKKMGDVYAQVFIKGEEKNIERMLILAKQLKKQGYNFWLNYED